MVSKESLWASCAIAEALRLAEEAECGFGGNCTDSGAAGMPHDGLSASSNMPKARKQHEAKLKQKQIQVKEVKFRPGTDEGDYNIKLRNLIKFSG